MPTFSRAAERFLSTPSARRATQTTKQGEKDWDISIHALREEGDMLGSAEAANEAIFLSTPSARRATPDRHRVQRSNRISIHALREEGDGVAMITMTPVTHFYPRPPRGGRLLLSSMPMHPKQFLSTPSARRATRLRPRSAFVQKFLSTPSARRATFEFVRLLVQGVQFLSTPSARRATAGIDTERLGWIFLSTPSARRATRYPCAGVRLHLISIHALREEGDDGAIQSGDSSTDFYPRPPRGGRRLR